MIEKVSKWNPPSSHAELKSFMIEQLHTSSKASMIQYLENELIEVVGSVCNLVEWKVARLKKLNDDIIYHTERHKEEIERTESRTQWIKDLRKSLEAV